MRTPSLLPSGKHHEEVNFVPIRYGFGEFVRVRGGMIDVNFNDVEEFIFFPK